MPITDVALIAAALSPVLIYLAFKRPLIFPLGLYIMLVPFDALLGTDTTVTRFVALACGGALVLRMLVTRKVLMPPASWPAWAAFILLASLTGLWTMDASRTVIAVPQLVGLFIFFSILAVYPAEPKDVRLIGAIVVLSGFFMAAVGTFGYLQGARTQENRMTVFMGGGILDPNHLAASLLLPIAIALGSVIGSRDVRLRLASLVAAGMMIMAVFLTGSRGGLIALSVMFLYLAWKTRYRLQIIGLMALAGGASLLSPTVWDRFQDKGLGAGSGRLFIWDAGRLALKDHWLNGAGFGAFQAAYNKELLSMYQPVFQGWSRPAHDAFLSAAVEVGVVGSLLLMYAWWRSWREASGNVVIEAGLVSLAVAAIFLDMILFKYLWLAFSMAALVSNASNPRYLRGGASKWKPSHRLRVPSRVRAWQTRLAVSRTERNPVAGNN